MKKIIFIISVFTIGCSAIHPVKETVSTNQTNNNLSYVVQENEVATFLKTLSSDDFQGREAGTPGIEKAAVYLENFLKQNNVKPYFDSYRSVINNYDKATFNIVGYIEGTDPDLKKEFVILSAHYDHIGMALDNYNDKVNNGANDDASGVTAVAQMAKYFSKTKSNKRSILIIFFTAEEKGLLGSKDLAQKLKAQKINLYTVLNFEMIGVPMNRSYTAYVTGYDKSNMAAKINEYAGKKIIGYLPQELEYELFSRSDNYSFYNAFKIPSQTVCTFDFENFKYYHDVKDEFELMDTKHMTSFIQNMIPAVQKMCDSKNKEILLN